MNTENNLWNPVEIKSTDNILLDAPEITRTASNWFTETFVDPVVGAGDWIDDNITQPALDTLVGAGDWIDDNITQPALDTLVGAGDWIDDNITQPIFDPGTQQVVDGVPDPLTGATDYDAPHNVQRFWDNQTQSHFFTADESEKQDRLNNPDRYSDEGNEFDVDLEGDELTGIAGPGYQTVYRYRNQTSNTYFYTFQTPSEITSQYPAFVSDGRAFLAYPEGKQPASSIPVYRFYNEGASATTGSPVHFFTADESNKQNVIDNYSSFKYEGVGWYAWSPNTQWDASLGL